MGLIVQYCLILVQYNCPICLSRLLTEHDLSTIPRLTTTIHKIHFDHLLTDIEDHDDLTDTYWWSLPMVVQMFIEEMSSFFVHVQTVLSTLSTVIDLQPLSVQVRTTQVCRYFANVK
jgi:hypothetical protein